MVHSFLLLRRRRLLLVLDLVLTSLYSFEASIVLLVVAVVVALFKHPRFCRCRLDSNQESA
jgi:hypothetical protein